VRLKYIHMGLPDPPDDLSEDVLNNLAQEFRYGKKGRVIGYLVEPVFYVIWVDPNHEFT